MTPRKLPSLADQLRAEPKPKRSKKPSGTAFNQMILPDDKVREIRLKNLALGPKARQKKTGKVLDTPEKRADAQRTYSLRYARKQVAFDKEIGGFPLAPGTYEGAQVAGINWERRLSCKNDLEKFCLTYLKAVFFYDW